MLKQRDFEGDAKKILGFEHILPKIGDIEKSCFNALHLNYVR